MEKKIKSPKLLVAEKIIHRHLLWAMAAGSFPVPIVDAIGVIFIQVDMLKQLCKLYEMDFETNIGKTLVTSIIASSSAKGISSLFYKNKFLDKVSMAVLSGAFTYAIGRFFISNFEQGVSIIDIDLKNGEELFDEYFEKGKEVLSK
jgi:uncharacterized protein (DUF697 family)